MKTRQRPIADVEDGHQTAVACHLANISLRVGRKVRWNMEKKKYKATAKPPPCWNGLTASPGTTCCGACICEGRVRASREMPRGVVTIHEQPVFDFGNCPNGPRPSPPHRTPGYRTALGLAGYALISSHARQKRRQSHPDLRRGRRHRRRGQRAASLRRRADRHRRSERAPKPRRRPQTSLPTGDRPSAWRATSPTPSRASARRRPQSIDSADSMGQ